MPADGVDPSDSTEKRPSPGDARVRALAFAGAGAIFLVIVAAATSGGFALRDERGSGGLIAPKLPSYAGWILIPLLLLAVVGSFAVFTQVVTGRRKRARAARTPLWAQFVTLVFVVLSVVALQKAGILDRFQNDARDRVVNEGGRASPAPEATDHVTRSGTLGLVVVIVLVVVLGGIAVLTFSVLRRQRALLSEAADPETETILRGVDAGIDDLSTVSDPRAAVIASYARMESALLSTGLGRRPSEAPLEFLGRVLTERNVLEASATTLTSLFERARFSEHAIDESQRADALGCLRDIRAQLGAAT